MKNYLKLDQNRPSRLMKDQTTKNKIVEYRNKNKEQISLHTLFIQLWLKKGEGTSADWKYCSVELY